MFGTPLTNLHKSPYPLRMSFSSIELVTRVSHVELSRVGYICYNASHCTYSRNFDTHGYCILVLNRT